MPTLKPFSLVTLGDSYTAYTAHPGSVVGTCSINCGLLPGVWNANFYGMPFGMCPSGCYLFPGRDDGFRCDGFTTNGVLIDRMAARSITPVEFTRGALAESQASTWYAHLPAGWQFGALPTGGIWHGVAGNGGVSPAEKIKSPNPSTNGRVLVWCTLGGNDIMNSIKGAGSTIADPYNYVAYDDAWNASYWDARFAQVKGYLFNVLAYVYALNPDAEVLLPGYTNFPMEDGSICSLSPANDSDARRRHFWADGYGFYGQALSDINTHCLDYANTQAPIVCTGLGLCPNPVTCPSCINMQRGIIYTQCQSNNPACLGWGYVQSHILHNFGNAFFRRLETEVWLPVVQAFRIQGRAINYIPTWTCLPGASGYDPGPMDFVSGVPAGGGNHCDILHMSLAGTITYADYVLDQWLAITAMADEYQANAGFASAYRTAQAGQRYDLVDNPGHDWATVEAAKLVTARPKSGRNRPDAAAPWWT